MLLGTGSLSSQCRFVNDELVTGSCAAPAQGRRSRWAWTKAIHAAFQGIAAVFIECVGSHGKDRDLCQCRIAQCADLPGGGVAVHHRHLHIHQHQIIAARCGSAYLFHRHGTVFRRIDPEAVLAQDLLRDLTVQLVVLYQQDVPALEVGALFGRSPAPHPSVSGRWRSSGSRAGRT